MSSHVKCVCAGLWVWDYVCQSTVLPNYLWWIDCYLTGNFNCRKKKSLHHRSSENANGNKHNWIPVLRICKSLYVCGCVCVCKLLSGMTIAREHRIRVHTLLAAEKPSSNNVLLQYTFVLMSKVEAVTYITSSKSRLSISASGAIFSSLVLVSVYYSPVFSPTLLPTLNLQTPTSTACSIPTSNG